MRHAFYIVPDKDVPLGEDFAFLSRAEKMQRMRRSVADLEYLIAGRLQGWEVEYLEGVGGWTVRRRNPATKQEVSNLLADLPVSVAPDDTFTAL